MQNRLFPLPRLGLEGQQAWLLTFADLVSLLLCFFVMLYATKAVDVEKFKQLQGAMTGVFGTLSQPYDLRPDADQAAENLPIMAADPLAYLKPLLQRQLATDPILRQAYLWPQAQPRALVISLPAALLFLPGEATLGGPGREAIQHLAALLANLDNAVVVAGHTDPAPIATADYPNNWTLSLARGLTVARLLRAAGVQVDQVQGLADRDFARLNPQQPEATRTAAARRVDVLILPEQP